MNKYSKNNEIWKDVKEFEGYYQVSNLGRVKSLNRTTSSGARRKGIILKPAVNTSGYSFVHLSKEGKIKRFYVHRLVAKTFIPKVRGKKEVDHIDTNKLNNIVSNLEWVCRSENMKRSWEKGLMENQRRSAIESGKSRAKGVIKMNSLGEVLGEYESQTQASIENDIPSPSISMCCTGKKKSAGGYFWKFADKAT